MSAIIASRYAKALMTLAAKDNQVDAAAQGVEDVAALIKGSAPLAATLDDVRITRPDKEKLLKAILDQAKVPALVGTFVQFVMEKRRLMLIGEIAAHFHRLADERLGRAQADVTVASALDPAQEKTLKQDLEKLSGKTVTLTVKVDPAILGGAITRVGDTVWDGSLRNQLNQIREQILKG